MKEITTSTREKLRVETDLSIMKPLWEFWHNQLIGSKCIFPNGEYSYLTWDFQVVTFDGEVRKVHFCGRLSDKDKSLVAGYFVHECKLVLKK
jgi:hypothetical protein